AADTSAGEAPPAPVAVLPADVATGGPLAAQLESVIVAVSNVTVTDIAPPPGTGDTPPTYEFVVDNAVRVNDYLYLITPFPLVGTNYASLTGILDYRNNDSKIELRGPADVVVGTPTLNAFGPPLTFADLGQTGAPTYPTPLTVQLNAAPAN